MHAIIWSFLVSLCWYVALTVGLPLTLAVTFSKTIRRIYFSWYFVKVVGPGLKVVSDSPRQRLFQLLRDSLPPNHAKLEALEIGIGEGANMQYYPENVSLTVLDVNEHFKKYFLENIKKYDNLEFKKVVIQNAEDMSQIEDDSLDFVVATYLHCSCNVDAVVKEARRVLKPGGKYLFLDHVSFPKGDILGRLIQFIIQPLWYVYGGGCVLNKTDNLDIIKGAGFSDVVCEDLVLDSFMYFLIKQQIMGMATK